VEGRQDAGERASHRRVTPSPDQWRELAAVDAGTLEGIVGERSAIEVHDIDERRQCKAAVMAMEFPDCSPA
jgi:hypothetical protein